MYIKIPRPGEYFKLNSLKKKKCKTPGTSVGYNSEHDTSPSVNQEHTVTLKSTLWDLGNKCQLYLKYYQKQKYIKKF